MNETEQRALALSLLAADREEDRRPLTALVHAALYVGDQLFRIADGLLGEEHASIVVHDGGPIT